MEDDRKHSHKVSHKIKDVHEEPTTWSPVSQDYLKSTSLMYHWTGTKFEYINGIVPKPNDKIWEEIREGTLAYPLKLYKLVADDAIIVKNYLIHTGTDITNLYDVSSVIHDSYSDNYDISAYNKIIKFTWSHELDAFIYFNGANVVGYGRLKK